jgi:hypothetical protein
MRSVLLVAPNQRHDSPRPVPARGAFRDRHERWARDAMDVSMPMTNGMERTAKSCRSGAPTLASSWRRCFSHRANDGDKKARSPGRARRKPLKPFARGMPDENGVIRGDLLVCFLFSHTRLRAHRSPGIPCALDRFREGHEFDKPRALAPRECFWRALRDDRTERTNRRPCESRDP